jgi:hypothetical protein
VYPHHDLARPVDADTAPPGRASAWTGQRQSPRANPAGAGPDTLPKALAALVNLPEPGRLMLTPLHGEGSHLVTGQRQRKRCVRYRITPPIDPSGAPSKTPQTWHETRLTPRFFLALSRECPIATTRANKDHHNHNDAARDQRISYQPLPFLAPCCTL